MLPVISLPDPLDHLVQYCEKRCVADCCGIEAFDFSPLHVASYICSSSGGITDSDIEKWEAELKKAQLMVAGLIPDTEGLICSVAGMNQLFTRSDFERFISELRHSIHMAPKVLEFSKQLRFVQES